MTEEVLNKLQEAFLFGSTDEEACAYANIAIQTLYKYQEREPEYLELKNGWKQNPFLRARKSLMDGLSDPELALKFLERKKKDEFALRNEYTGKDGKDLIPTPILSSIPEKTSE